LKNHFFWKGHFQGNIKDCVKILVVLFLKVATHPKSFFGEEGSISGKRGVKKFNWICFAGRHSSKIGGPAADFRGEPLQRRTRPRGRTRRTERPPLCQDQSPARRPQTICGNPQAAIANEKSKIKNKTFATNYGLAKNLYQLSSSF
jgi:hypothetical protein